MVTSSKDICCIGAGYIGGPTMAVMAYHNPDKNFYVCDINKDRIDAWNSENLPIYEPGLDNAVHEVRNKNLFFTSDVKTAVERCGIIFIGVNTPTKEYGEGAGFASDLKYWEGAARSVAEYAKGDKIIVEKSTLPVKTADAISRILHSNSLYHFTIISNPEFLAEGTAIKDLQEPDRVLIGGVDHAAIDQVSELYESWVPKEKIIRTGLWSSELSKLAANAMLAQRVSSINALACVCEETGADVSEVAEVVGRDSRIGAKFLKAGPGFGGSCFKKDILNLVYLCKSCGLDEPAEYWNHVIKMNEWQQERIIKRLIKKSFGTFANKTVAVLGYAFKANTGDTRETPAKHVIDLLKEEHATIQVYDPKAGPHAKMEVETESCVVKSTAYEALANADIAIILTDWAEFKQLDWMTVYSLMRHQRTIYDTRNCVDAAKLTDLGFDVMCTGLG